MKNGRKLQPVYVAVKPPPARNARKMLPSVLQVAREEKLAPTFSLK